MASAADVSACNLATKYRQGGGQAEWNMAHLDDRQEVCESRVLIEVSEFVGRGGMLGRYETASPLFCLLLLLFLFGRCDV